MSARKDRPGKYGTAGYRPKDASPDAPEQKPVLWLDSGVLINFEKNQDIICALSEKYTLKATDVVLYEFVFKATGGVPQEIMPYIGEGKTHASDYRSIKRCERLNIIDKAAVEIVPTQTGRDIMAIGRDEMKILPEESKAALKDAGEKAIIEKCGSELIASNDVKFFTADPRGMPFKQQVRDTADIINELIKDGRIVPESYAKCAALYDREHRHDRHFIYKLLSPTEASRAYAHAVSHPSTTLAGVSHLPARDTSCPGRAAG